MGDLLAEVSKESKCIVVSCLTVSLQQPCSSAAELPTSRPCTHGGRCSHLCAFLPLFLARLSTDPVLRCSSRALPHAPGRGTRRSPCSEKVASTRFGTRPPVGAVTYLSTHSDQPLPRGNHWSEPAGHADRPRRPTRNWLCSTLLLFRCFVFFA